MLSFSSWFLSLGTTLPFLFNIEKPKVKLGHYEDILGSGGMVLLFMRDE
jgi:hypothetical protein